MTDDYPSRTIGIVLSILFTLLPLVIAIYLFWTVVVGPEDPVVQGQPGGPASGKQTKPGKSK